MFQTILAASVLSFNEQLKIFVLTYEQTQNNQVQYSVGQNVSFSLSLTSQLGSSSFQTVQTLQQSDIPNNLLRVSVAFTSSTTTDYVLATDIYNSHIFIAVAATNVVGSPDKAIYNIIECAAQASSAELTVDSSRQYLQVKIRDPRPFQGCLTTRTSVVVQLPGEQLKLVTLSEWVLDKRAYEFNVLDQLYVASNGETTKVNNDFSNRLFACITQNVIVSRICVQTGEEQLYQVRGIANQISQTLVYVLIGSAVVLFIILLSVVICCVCKKRMNIRSQSAKQANGVLRM